MHAEQAERWETLEDDVRALLGVLRRMRWRLGLEQMLLFALRGLMSSAAALTALTLAAVLASAQELRTGYVWLACVPLAVGLGLAVLRWPSPRQAAIAADRRLVLHERLGTAVEIAHHPTGRFDRVQIRDAVEKAQAIPTRALAMDRRVRREALLAAVLVGLAGASMLLGNLPRPGALTPDESIAPSDAGLPPAALDVSAPEDLSVQTLADARPIEQSPADPNLADRVQQAQAESAALDKLSKALASVSAAQPAADAVQRRDFSQARDQLASLGAEADQLSDAAKQQLSAALQEAASQTAATDRQLADRERQAGQALARPNYNEQRQALNALADQVERSGTRSAPPDQLARDAGLVQQQAASQGQQPAGQSTGNASPGQSSTNDGAPTAAQQPGANAEQQGAGTPGQQGGPGVGNGTNPDVLGDQPSRLDSAGQTVAVPPKLGSGPGVRPPTGAEDQTGTDPTSGARSVSELVQAQQTGQVAPEQNLVPGEQRPVVRGYFR
ncbi:MAG: hypothetical protein M3069_20315 [Chloroflexota bacterium]|nr:hypothetical protein [Chloroflexota bacterium]